MFRKYVKYFLILGLLTLCLSAKAGYLPPPGTGFYGNGNNVVQKFLGYFTNLEIAGNIDIEIKTGMQQSQLIITGHPQDLAHIHVKQENDTVMIWPDSGYPQCGRNPQGRVHIEVYTHFLNNLVLKDYQGRLQANNLNTPYFNADLDNNGTVLLNGKIGLHDLIVSGNGKNLIQNINSQSVNIVMTDNPTVDLSGVANLEMLKAEGAGNLRLYWVDSDRLTIRQNGKTTVELSGIANFVDLELKDKSHFYGQYLRVKDGYIKTWDESTAYIQFLKAQSLLANDDSTISFYGKPPYQVNFMGKNGAALDMTDH